MLLRVLEEHQRQIIGTLTAEEIFKVRIQVMKSAFVAAYTLCIGSDTTACGRASVVILVDDLAGVVQQYVATVVLRYDEF